MLSGYDKGAIVICQMFMLDFPKLKDSFTGTKGWYAFTLRALYSDYTDLPDVIALPTLRFFLSNPEPKILHTKPKTHHPELQVLS